MYAPRRADQLTLLEHNDRLIDRAVGVCPHGAVLRQLAADFALPDVIAAVL